MKSLLFIIVVIVYYQYLGEKWKENKRSFLPLFASHYALVIISANILDVRVSIAKVDIC